MCASRAPLRRRASTPLPCAHENRQRGSAPIRKLYSPSKASVSAHCSGSLDSGASDGINDAHLRVVLLGDPGVGKSSLMAIFQREQDIEAAEQQQGMKNWRRHPVKKKLALDEGACYSSLWTSEVFECTLMVDGEETTLLVMDMGECEMKKAIGSRDSPMRLGNAYIIVYSVTDRASFESASELRIQLRRTRQAENIPIILVGNKTDLVRSREVSVEEGRACAVVFDCKFIETSAVLQHNVKELFEGMVRQIRLRREGADTSESFRLRSQRKESLTKRARRFLDRLVTRNSKSSLKVHSRSCHDLSVL